MMASSSIFLPCVSFFSFIPSFSRPQLPLQIPFGRHASTRDARFIPDTVFYLSPRSAHAAVHAAEHADCLHFLLVTTGPNEWAVKIYTGDGSRAIGRPCSGS